MPLSSQSEDKEVLSSKRLGYYDETESAMSPPIDSQASQPEKEEVVQPINSVKKGFQDLKSLSDADDENYSDDAEFWKNKHLIDDFTFSNLLTY